MPIPKMESRETTTFDYLFRSSAHPYPDLPSYIKPSDAIPLQVAGAALMAGIGPRKIQGIGFSTQHHDFLPYIAEGTGGLKKLKYPYAIGATDSVFRHPAKENAQILIDELKGMENPWGKNLSLAKSIFSRLEMELPPIVALVATDQDFPEDTETGDKVGKNVSIVDRSIRMGIIRSEYDMPLVLGYGSKIWAKGIISVPGRAFRSTEHELVHFLTLLYLMGTKALDMEVIADKNDLPSGQAFSLPIWEGIADILGDKLTHIRTEQQMINKGLLKIDDERSFLIAPERKLGSVAQTVNQILVGILFRLWEGEDIDGMVYDQQRNRESTIAFLERCYGRLGDISQNDPEGTLVKKIFEEDGFDWQKAVNQVRNLVEAKMDLYISPLMENESSRKVMKVWKERWQEGGKKWEPFGDDSFRNS